MTRCSHIQQLNFPWDDEILQDYQKTDVPAHELANYYPPYGRFKAEYWMNNDAGPRIPEPIYRIHDIPLDKKYGLIPPEQICTNHLDRLPEYRGEDDKVDISDTIWQM